jgi:AbrB family looped-hinge helix DNA binding protein
MDISVSFTKLSSKGQITLPKAVRTAARLMEGDPVKVEVTEDGAIVLRPQKMVDANQAWFFSPAWQEGEVAASADIVAGRLTRYDNEKDFLASFDD